MNRSTIVFEKIKEAFASGSNKIACVGGLHSSKTISILQFILKQIKQSTGGLRVIVFCKKGVAFNCTVVCDLKNILNPDWNTAVYNKSECCYYLNNSSIVFKTEYDMTDPFVSEGADIIYYNECSLDFIEKSKPCLHKAIILVEALSTMQVPGDYTIIKTSYKDNPFLSDGVVECIKSMGGGWSL